MQYLEIDLFLKTQYERRNPVSWKKYKCVICKMPLKVEPFDFDIPDNEMSYRAFFIRFEHKFLRNVCSIEELKKSKHLLTLENYYEIY